MSQINNNMNKEWNEPYNVPSGYFEQLNAQILAQTTAKKPKHFILRWSAAAALFVAIGAFAFWKWYSAPLPAQFLALHSPQADFNTTNSLELTHVLADEINADKPSTIAVSNAEISKDTIPAKVNTNTNYELLLMEQNLIPLDIEEELLGDIEI